MTWVALSCSTREGFSPLEASGMTSSLGGNLSPEDRKLLSLARTRGWLRPEGSPEDQERQGWAWYFHCRENHLDSIVAQSGSAGTRIEVEVAGPHQLSSLAYQELQELMSLRGLDGSWGGTPSEVSLEGGSQLDLSELVRQIQEILRRDRTPERGVHLQNLFGGVVEGMALVEGMAVVVDPNGLWDDLEAKDRVYIRQIPGRPGRCIALRHNSPPLVDLPLEKFRILADCDV